MFQTHNLAKWSNAGIRWSGGHGNSILEHRQELGDAQDIQIIDQSGVHYLRYFLVDTTKGWKISHVQFWMHLITVYDDRYAFR